jgi:hypothetical protein
VRHLNVRCRFCGRPLVFANIPNRGPVMAHRPGERKLCDRLREEGRDMESTKARNKE